MKNSHLQYGIRLLETAFGIHLSKEQLAVVEYDVKSPVLVNACAGAGKTMLFLFIALCLIVTNKCKPFQVLGVTFSKQAQIDMNKRYWNDVKKLRHAGGSRLISHGAPTFTTFHALFYHLLKMIGRYHNVKVLPSYEPISYILSKHIPHPSRLESSKELLKRIFQHRSQLINKRYTYDGIHLSNQRSDIKYMMSQHNANRFSTQGKHDAFTSKLIDLKLMRPKDSSDISAYENYQQVVKAYNNYKYNHKLIDFSDMEVDLAKILDTDPQAKELIQKALSGIKYVFLDEFQDINDVQWQLINQILSPEALSHLVTIGDDDQSIYSFRGSNPKIILEYHRHYPKSKTFNLSTNYRTGGNILATVRSLITSNQYRLNKRLLTGRPHKGHFIEYFSNDRRFTANDILFKHLLKQIHNKHIKNSDIAVLIHYNNSRMFLIDQLATHGYYMPVDNNDYILQNNYIYKILIQLAKGLALNQFQPIRRSAPKIGFSIFTAHIRSVISAFNHTVPKTITQYCSMALEYDRKYKRKLSSKVLATDHDLAMHIKSIQNLSAVNQNQIGQSIWIATATLTKAYFDFMCKNNYMNEKMVKSIKTYLSSEFSKIHHMNDIRRFFHNEFRKRMMLSKDRKQKNPIHVLSLHQSKGLQFKYVYMYDINARRDSPSEIKLSNSFPPNLTFKQFLNFVISTPQNKLNAIDDEFFGANRAKMTGFSYLSVKINQFMTENMIQPNKFIDRVTNHKLIGSQMEIDLQDQIWFWYRRVIHSSSFIEEQRRLIYVGITRAQDVLYLAYNRDADPLLNELSIPDSDKYYLEVNGYILNYKQNQRFQQILKQARRKIQK